MNEIWNVSKTHFSFFPPEWKIPSPIQKNFNDGSGVPDFII